MSFTVDPTNDPGTVIVHIGEGLDFRNVAMFKALCQEQVRAAVRHFILDFSEASLLDSVGLGAIFSLYRSVTPANGQVVFAAVSAPVKVMVQVTKIYRVFPQYRTIALACEALRITK
jgi:anti-sigma B factor antagonist